MPTDPNRETTSPYDLCTCGHHRYAHRGGPSRNAPDACTAALCACMSPFWGAVAVAPAPDPLLVAREKQRAARALLVVPILWAAFGVGLAFASPLLGLPWWALPAIGLAFTLAAGVGAIYAGFFLAAMILEMQKRP